MTVIIYAKNYLQVTSNGWPGCIHPIWKHCQSHDRQMALSLIIKLSSINTAEASTSYEVLVKFQIATNLGTEFLEWWLPQNMYLCEHRSLQTGWFTLQSQVCGVSHWAWKVAGDVKHDGLLLSDTLLAPFIVLLSVCSHPPLFFCVACCQPVEAAMVAKLLAVHIFHTEHTTFK